MAPRRVISGIVRKASKSAAERTEQQLRLQQNSGVSHPPRGAGTFSNLGSSLQGSGAALKRGQTVGPAAPQCTAQLTGTDGPLHATPQGGGGALHAMSQGRTPSIVSVARDAMQVSKDDSGMGV